MKSSISRNQEQSVTIAAQANGLVRISMSATLNLVATHEQLIDWLLTRSKVAYAEFHPLSREEPITYQPDEPYTEMPASLVIWQITGQEYTVHCYNIRTYQGDIHGLIRFLIDLLPRPNEDPPRI